MSVYERWILPRILDAVMRRGVLGDYRRRTIPGARGTVLEVGIGSGLNLALYEGGVARVYGIDPSAELLAMARLRATNAHFPLLLLRASAEALPLATASVDTVVMTWALCSIPDPAAALREMARVLRPGGRLLFVEHGLAPDAAVSRWQRWLTPGWRRIGGGCHLDRKMDDLIAAAGFEIGGLGTGYMDGPKLVGFMYQGWARAPKLGRARETVAGG